MSKEDLHREWDTYIKNYCPVGKEKKGFEMHMDRNRYKGAVQGSQSED